MSTDVLCEHPRMERDFYAPICGCSMCLDMAYGFLRCRACGVEVMRDSNPEYQVEAAKWPSWADVEDEEDDTPTVALSPEQFHALMEDALKLPVVSIRRDSFRHWRVEVVPEEEYSKVQMTTAKHFSDSVNEIIGDPTQFNQDVRVTLQRLADGGIIGPAQVPDQVVGSQGWCVPSGYSFYNAEDVVEWGGLPDEKEKEQE